MRRQIQLRSRHFLFNRWIGFILFIIILAVTLGFWVSSQFREIYIVSLNGQQIGIASSPDLVNAWVKNQKQEFEARYPGVHYTTNDVEITSERKFNGKTDDVKLFAELEKRYTLKAQGTEVFIDGKWIGIVKNKQTAQNALKRLESQFVSRKPDPKVTVLSYKADRSNPSPVLKSVKFVEPISFKTTVVEDPNQFLSEDKLLEMLQGKDVKSITYRVQEGDCISCIAQKFNIPQQVIYDNNPWIENDFIDIGDQLDLTVRRPRLSVKSVEQWTETVQIPNGVKITYDENMRKGTVKVVQQGKPGKKKLIYMTTKINGELVDEVVVEEEVLVKPIPKQVIQGSKVIRGIGTGSFAWPITGPKITSEFGKRWGRLHAGTDTVSSNRNIMASDNGKVVFAGTNSGYGKHIIIDHQNGYRTLYAHLSKINVKEGATVEKGELIGIMGSTGRSTGVHLHFEIRKNDKQVNPLKFLD